MSEEALTLSVPEAGRRYFGLSRNSSYAAAERGDIPVIKVGRVLRVPIRAMERLLDGAGAKPKDEAESKPKKRAGKAR
jgi:hypothetical protein